MLASDSHSKMSTCAATCAGKIGSSTRRKPYTPIFSRMAANTIEPPVGACVWASGNQVWNGQSGTLMAKPTNVAQNNTEANVAGFHSQRWANSASFAANWPLPASSRNSIKSNVPVARNRNPNATSIPKLPARV